MSTEEKLRWESGYATDKGFIRKRNEDDLLCLDSDGMWLVADGAGGHDNGHIASKTAVRFLLADYRTTHRLGTDTRNICRLLNRANTDLLKSYANTHKISASTVSVVITDGKNVVCIWTGDSPIYRLRNKKLIQLSRDHNRIEEFMKQGLSYEKCLDIPQAQHLTQALGASENLCLQTRWADLKDGDCFIICSDGVSKELSLLDIEVIAKKNMLSAKSLTQNLMSETIKREARDNLTVITIRFSTNITL